jgi:multidrug resistance protein, MATE family
MANQNYIGHFKTNFHLAIPVMMSQLGHMMVGVADSIMVGRLGAVPLAGASLANVIFHITLMFGIGVSYAITPLVATADGEGNVKKSADYLKHAIIINLFTGALLFLIIFIASTGLYHLDQPEEVVAMAVPYLNVITFSLIPLMIFQTFRQFAEGLSDTRHAMVIVIVSNLVNVGLNYILIYGKLGFAPMGLLGAGYASFISRIILASWMALYIYYGSRFSPYRLGFTIGNYSKKIFRKMLSIGLPAGFQFMFEVGAFGFAVIMIGWIGTEELAAHQIAINLAAISYMMASGLASAATIRVGNQLGLKDVPTLRAAAFTLYAMVIIFMGVTATIFIVGRYFLPTLYIADTAVIEVASTLLIIAGFFQISDGIQVLSLGALRGLHDVKIPTLLTFIAYWVLALPTGYILGFVFEMGAAGVWYGLLIGLTIVAVAMLWRFNVITKRMLAPATPVN